MWKQTHMVGFLFSLHMNLLFLVSLISKGGSAVQEDGHQEVDYQNIADDHQDDHEVSPAQAQGLTPFLT